ncbi:MAG: GTP-binding protein [Flavobacteriaceae bacterium]|nr:GTP-binding protein [Flavobacteriaceae bacterium]
MEMAKKIVLMGQFGVGKSSIARRYLLDVFKKDYLPTLGVQIKKKVIEMPSGNLISMIIWDLEGFSSVSKTRASYLLGSNGFIYVFDLTRPFTYYHLEEEIDFIKNEYPQVTLRVIGNKKDLENSNKVEQFLKGKNITVDNFVSAKTGEGIQELFTDLANTFGT